MHCESLYCETYTDTLSYHIICFHLSFAVTPIPIVVISLASRYQYYGILDEQGNLSLYAEVA